MRGSPHNGSSRVVAQVGMVVEVEGVGRRGVDETVVGGDDDDAVAVAGVFQQLREACIQRLKGFGDGFASDAVLVRQAVVLRPVGMDVAAWFFAAQQSGEAAEHLVERRIAVPSCAAGKRHVEVGMDDVVRAHHVARQGQAVEQRCQAEQVLRRDTGRAQGVATGADTEGQRCGDGTDLTEIHVPAGQAMLLRRQAGEKGGDGAGRGGRKNRAQLALQMAAQRAVVAEQKVEPEAVDHQQYHMPRGGQRLGRQGRQRRIGAGAAERSGDRAHQVDQAAALVIGQAQIGILGGEAG
jgi:hypothetical protein